MAVGALAGGAVWKSTFGEAGVAESFVDDLRKSLAPGIAALVQRRWPRRASDETRPGGRLLGDQLRAASSAS